MNGNHPNYKILEIGQNTKKSPGDLIIIIIIIIRDALVNVQEFEI